MMATKINYDQLGDPRTVPLYTADGQYVCCVAAVPAHLAADRGTPMEVLIWGSRHFVWNAEKRQYREACAFWSASDAETFNPGPAMPLLK